jgi:tetratricopeptide (TPR) repeat protein
MSEDLIKIFSDDNVDCFIYLPKNCVNNKVWVSFGAYQETELFGLNFFKKNSIPSIIIKPHKNEWYQDKSTPLAIKKAVNHFVTKGFEIDCGYGSSMGAFAAIAYSELYRPNIVIAIAPQVSIFESDIGIYDIRWRDISLLIEPIISDCRTGFYSSAELIILYDPLHLEDKFHTRLIAAKLKCFEITLILAGHGVLHTLSQMDMLELFIKKIYSSVTNLIENKINKQDFELTIANLKSKYRLGKRSTNNYWFNLAELMTRRGKIDTAIIFLHQSIRILETGYALNFLAKLYIKKEDFNHALACYSRSVVLSPNIGAYLLEYGSALVRCNFLHKAKYVFELAQRLFPNVYGSFSSAADVYSRLGLYEKSLNSIEKAIMLNGNIAQFYEHKAEMVRLIADGKVNSRSVQPIARSKVEMYQNYFDGIWNLGIRISPLTELLPYGHLVNVQPDIFKAIWQMEQTRNAKFFDIDRASAEIILNGSNKNEYVKIRKSGEIFYCFDFIAPFSGSYTFNIFLIGGIANLICQSHIFNLHGGACYIDTAELDAGQVYVANLLPISDEVMLGIKVTDVHNNYIKSPGSNFKINKTNFKSIKKDNNSYIGHVESIVYPKNENNLLNLDIEKYMNTVLTNFSSKTAGFFKENNLKKNKYLLFFVPRSGSTLLTQLMANTNVVGYPLEFFTPNIYYYLKSRVLGGGFEYLAYIEDKFVSSNNYFGCQIDFDRYNNYWQHYYYGSLDSYKIILVDRKDFVSQLVSQYFMEVTEIGFATAELDNNVNFLETDIDKILNTALFLIRHKIGIRKLNPKCLNILYYEEIVSNTWQSKIANILLLSEADSIKLKSYEQKTENESTLKPTQASSKTQFKQKLLKYISDGGLKALKYKVNQNCLISLVPIDACLVEILELLYLEPDLLRPFVYLEY